MNEWLTEHLVCPRDKQALEAQGEDLVCSSGHRYPVVNEIPVMLVADAEVTHEYISRTLEDVEAIRAGTAADAPEQGESDGIDAFVQGEVPYTSGILYFSVQHRLTRYPIPETRLPLGNGERLLDIGCNWGRWSIAASWKNYRPVGLDPSLKAVMAAKRVAGQLGADADFIVGDARFLPFRDDSFDTVFCYSVYQHLSKENVRTSLDEAARVLRTGGISLIQMPNKYGIRQYQQHRRRGFTEGEGFEVRYWTPSELMETFEAKFGETEMTADCYFGLGIQGADVDLLPVRYKAVVYASEAIRNLSRTIKPLVKAADSIYLRSINEKGRRETSR
jgi:ubiquinone/menaquinone biosynthesis C-methylase UbiE/uncharacterized protein YbaR (Trm112 family)